MAQELQCEAKQCLAGKYQSVCEGRGSIANQALKILLPGLLILHLHQRTQRVDCNANKELFERLYLRRRDQSFSISQIPEIRIATMGDL
ncbi:hypothetical protein CCR98_02155 [Stenotrophomonas sp. WZN-1]|nr:hypothetical protein CCR98_02155 [Stenotrophomonas sp. WZN-1]